MKANELMLGDFVYHYHNDDGIAPYKEITRIEPEDLTIDAEVFEVRFKPIPLTPEILEKNGFEYERNAGYVYDDQMGTIVAYSTFIHRLKIIKYLDVLYDSQDYADISVHKLQHALRLCGIDKEIII